MTGKKRPRGKEFYAELEKELQQLEAEDPKIKALGDEVREVERRVRFAMVLKTYGDEQHADGFALGWGQALLAIEELALAARDDTRMALLKAIDDLEAKRKERDRKPGNVPL